MINKFTKEFANEFCQESGEIDWEKLVQFNSSAIEEKKNKIAIKPCANHREL